MAFTDAISVTIGDATKASTPNALADNTEFLRTNSDVQHNFDITTGTGYHKDIIAITAGTTTKIQIDNTAADGDPILAFALSGVDKFTLGVDDGDGDKLKIGTTAVGTGTMVTLDSATGAIGIGTTTPTADTSTTKLRVQSGGLEISGVITANVNSLGGYLWPTLTAAANNNNLYSFRADPIFNVGSYTGTVGYGIYINTKSGSPSTYYSFYAADGPIYMGGKVEILGTWQAPLLIGAKRLWYDVTNTVLRVKGSDPSSETDGNLLVEG